MTRAVAALLAVLAAPPADAVPWTSAAGEPPGPGVTEPVPGEDGGTRFAFGPGPRHVVGYVQIPLPGDRLHAEGVSAVELVARASAPATLDVVLVTADDAWRAPVAFDPGWSRHRVSFDELRPDRADAARPVVPRYFRLEAPARGLESPVTLDLRDLSFPPGPRAAPLPVAPEPAASAPPVRRPLPSRVRVEDGRFRVGDEALFPFGLFLLGGNRSLLETLGMAGANAVMEYGAATWPLVTVEDHLDYGWCTGVRVAAALTDEARGGRLADARLAPLASHPALLAWYLFDEPDGAEHRGVPREICSPERLAERRGDLETPPPVFVVCVQSFGLARWAAAGDVLATDTYWPAMGRSHSMAAVHSDAESVVEIAARTRAAPVQVLQLSDPLWERAPQEPGPLRTQVLGSLAAGIRGVFLFQGAATLRRAREVDDPLWDAFLELAADVATWGPLAARWTRLPGALSVSPPLGEVRASCFELGDERWIVAVNLGREPADAVLAGPAFADAVRLEDPANGWRSDVVDGRWAGRIEPGQGGVVRIVGADEPPRAPVRVEGRVPAPAAGRAMIHYDRAVLGATLVPAPSGEIAIALDGEELPDVVVHRGPAAVVRSLVRDLAPGPHTVEIRWEEEGSPRIDRWNVQVKRAPVPFTDRFERAGLGDAWGVVRDVHWNVRDADERPAEGDVRIEGGELRVRSTGGSIGVVLRKTEAPADFAFAFRVRLPADGAILIRRNELFRTVALSAGSHEVVYREEAGRQTLEVDGAAAGAWTPRIDHRGGEIALGVPPGGEAFFDDFTLQRPPR